MFIGIGGAFFGSPFMGGDKIYQEMPKLALLFWDSCAIIYVGIPVLWI